MQLVLVIYTQEVYSLFMATYMKISDAPQNRIFKDLCRTYDVDTVQYYFKPISKRKRIELFLLGYSFAELKIDGMECQIAMLNKKAWVYPLE